MSIYGQGFVALTEAQYMEQRHGLFTIANCKKNPEAVPVFEDGGNYYISSADFQRFCEACGTFNVEDAFSQICEANNINESTTAIVYDGCDPYMVDMIKESSIIYEESVEDGAMSMKKAEKWYNKFIKASTNTKKDNIETINAKITTLKSCVKKMEYQLDHVIEEGGIVKYVLKDFIPFNAVYRLIKRGDIYGMIGNLTNLIMPGASMVVRAVAYKSMLRDQIKKTNEAIKLLEDKKEELKRSK